MEFQVRYLALFLLFSVIDDFEWFWMESLHKNIQLMLEFLKAPFLVLHFSYYTLMTFLMLSVILLSMLMILLSTLSAMGHMICGNNLNWLLELNLIYKTLWKGAIVGIGVSTHPKNTTPSFLPRSPLNQQTVQAPLSRQSPPTYGFFKAPPKSRIFQ